MLSGSLAFGVGLPGQVAERVVGITPGPHIGVSHLGLSSAQVLAQAGRRPAAGRLRQAVQCVIVIAHPGSRQRADLLRPAKAVAQTGCGIRLDQNRNFARQSRSRACQQID